jgi:hypothetical protein
VDYKEFYNDAINKEVSLRDHILLWMVEKEKAQKNGRFFDKYEKFNLCAYPWVLDAASKSEVMKHQNRFVQARTVDN